MTEESQTPGQPERQLCDLGVAELRAGFSAGTFTPVHVLDSVRARAEVCEPTLNALWYPDFDAARVEAEKAAKRWAAGQPQGVLDGVPVTIKENIARRGVPMPSGHAAGDPQPVAYDAPITERLRESGAVIFASTVMPDWGMLSSGVSSRHGITRSPIAPSLTTGGSSAGAGAAAAAGYGPIHIGSDIGGSVRLPGTWLGLAALKPSFGRIPLDAPYLGRCAGPLARRVADVRLALEVIGRPDVRDYSELPPHTGDCTADFQPAQVRVAVHTEAGCGASVNPEVAAVVRRCADVLAAAGAHVEEIAPFMDDGLLADVDRFLRVRSWVDYAALPIAEQRKILPYIAEWCMAGADISGAEVLRCYNEIQRMRQRTVAATAPFDFVLSPVAPMPAFPAEWPMPFKDPQRPMQHIGFTVPYNMSEQPAISVHAGFTGDGRTVGLQIAGRRFDDAGVLAAAAWFESNLAAPRPKRTVGLARS
jgi:aspartyl-tRNA(Asn)/glutamyl-tRNA(Gln) amidotransferase subunit A